MLEHATCEMTTLLELTSRQFQTRQSRVRSRCPHVVPVLGGRRRFALSTELRVARIVLQRLSGRKVCDPTVTSGRSQVHRHSAQLCPLLEPRQYETTAFARRFA